MLQYFPSHCVEYWLSVHQRQYCPPSSADHHHSEAYHYSSDSCSHHCEADDRSAHYYSAYYSYSYSFKDLHS